MNPESTPLGTALVVGAARGIGAATASRLAADGFDLVCADMCAGDGDPSLDYPLATTDELDVTVASLADAGVVLGACNSTSGTVTRCTTSWRGSTT